MLQLGIELLTKGAGRMARRGTKIEKIIETLRKVEVLVNQGDTVPVACRKAELTTNTYYRWRKSYGGVRLDQAKRMKEMEAENARLKKLVADLSLDNAILREANSGNV
jgi:putative transposase